jgi:hypothetical protein
MNNLEEVVTFSNFSVFLILIVDFGTASAQAQDQWPEKMLRDMECLKRHGLIQGTVTEVLRGEAHFAPYFRELAIGGKAPSIRYNGPFIEGKTRLSPDIIKICIPNATLRKID